jgi:hypothetical protein
MRKNVLHFALSAFLVYIPLGVTVVLSVGILMPYACNKYLVQFRDGLYKSSLFLPKTLRKFKDFNRRNDMNHCSLVYACPVRTDFGGE